MLVGHIVEFIHYRVDEADGLADVTPGSVDCSCNVCFWVEISIFGGFDLCWG